MVNSRVSPIPSIISLIISCQISYYAFTVNICLAVRNWRSCKFLFKLLLKSDLVSIVWIEHRWEFYCLASIYFEHFHFPHEDSCNIGLIIRSGIQLIDSGILWQLISGLFAVNYIFLYSFLNIYYISPYPAFPLQGLCWSISIKLCKLFNYQSHLCFCLKWSDR